MMSATNTFAVIDIGSNELRLRIGQSVSNDKIKFIDTLNYPISLGSDTFHSGKITFEKVDLTCQVLQNFLQVMKEYGVTNYTAVATTAVREAVNRNYILDQIKVKTGIEVKVLDNTTEKLYIYKIMYFLLMESLKQTSLMVYIGSGNIGLSVFQDRQVTFTQNIKVGTLRTFEIFADIQEYSKEFYKVVEEYLESVTVPLTESMPSKIQHFFASGNEISLIANLCNAERDDIFIHINKDRFLQLYDDIKHKTVENIVTEYEIPLYKAETLLPAMCIYKNLLAFTNANEIITPLVYLSDALVFEALHKDSFNAIHKDFTKNAIAYARILAKKYQQKENVIATIESFSLKIFDKMKKIHGLGKQEKVLLQISAILCSIGNYINTEHYYYHSYSILSSIDIVGITQREMDIIANIVYYHCDLEPDQTHANYQKLAKKDRVLVSKLTAILRLSTALNVGQNQKIKDIDIKIDEQQWILTIISNKNTELEEWAFQNKWSFFQEVFGLELVIKKKKVI